MSRAGKSFLQSKQSDRPRLYLPIIVVACLIARPAMCEIPAPIAVEAAARNTTTVQVFWDPVAGGTAYRITRDGQTIGETGPEATRFIDTSAQPNTTYRYNVVAVGKDGSAHSGREYVERTYAPLPDNTPCDVLVVGATTAGIAAAATAARYGLKVVLIE